MLDSALLAAYLIVMLIISMSAMYAFMWAVLCVVRFIPIIGRKHRHCEWDRLNR